MYDSLCILGPTASGKTAIAVEAAYRLGGEIISADSRQVYKGMDIGTGKDLDDYEVRGKNIAYHMIDIVPAGAKYNLFKYQSDFIKVWKGCAERGVFPVICGGSGMYIEALIRGYRLDPVPENPALRAELSGYSIEELAHILSRYKKLHNTTEIDTPKRAIRAIEIQDYYSKHKAETGEVPLIHPLIVGVDISREERRKRISVRLRKRLEEGMVEEVEKLLKQGIPSEDLIYYGLEYKYITLYLTGVSSYENMVKELETAIHRFAKRQMTWFRKMEREGIPIHWMDGLAGKEAIVDEIASLLFPE